MILRCEKCNGRGSTTPLGGMSVKCDVCLGVGHVNVPDTQPEVAKVKPKASPPVKKIVAKTASEEVRKEDPKTTPKKKVASETDQLELKFGDFQESKTSQPEKITPETPFGSGGSTSEKN